MLRVILSIFKKVQLILNYLLAAGGRTSIISRTNDELIKALSIQLHAIYDE